jgi:branched-chain amino acid transport system permease protein
MAIAFPLAMHALDQQFYTSFASRVLIYAMAAASLNLVLGYGGMVSFGHAAFFGAGAYIVGILAAEGVTSLWIAWPAAVVLAALAALLIGAISLRTRGVYFIMITLAFAQMMYYVFVSLKAYGGDDGLSLPKRPIGELAWYYLVLILLMMVLYFLHRLLRSRFGRVIEAIRENETRAAAIGFPVYRYQLLCFVISGAIAGLAGALIASQTSYVGPALLHWVQSGTLMIMVILGGVGRFWGGPVGAVVLLALEELFSGSPLLGPYSLHWQLPVGIILLAVVLFAPRGITGAFAKKSQ